jgi:hypothetical protein
MDVTYIPEGRGFNPAEQAADIEALEKFVADGTIPWDWRNGNQGFRVSGHTGQRTAFPIDRGYFERAPPTALADEPLDTQQVYYQMWYVANGGNPWRNPLNSIASLPDTVRLQLTTDPAVQAIIAQEGFGRIKFNTTTRRFESGSFDIGIYRGKEHLGNALTRLESLNDQYAAGQAVAGSGAAEVAAGAGGVPAGAAVAGSQRAPQAVAGSGAAAVAGSGDNLPGGARALTSAAQAGTGSGSAQTAAQIARSATYVLRFASTSVGPYSFITTHAPLCFSYVGDPVVVPGEAGDGYGYLVPVGTNNPDSFGDAIGKGGQQFVYIEKIKNFDAQLMAEGAGAPLRDTAELVAQ